MQDNKVVLEIRPQNKKYGAGKICIPGGKIEKNETPKQAFFRELEEELGIVPLDFKLIYTCIDTEELDGEWELFYYLVTKWKGTIEQKDVGDLLFEDLNSVSRVLHYQADKDAVKKIQEVKL